MKNPLTLALSAVASILFASCAQTGLPNPLAAESQNTQTKTLTGAAAGAAAGYIAGGDSTEKRQKATVGGILGAGAGYLWGKNQDVQPSNTAIQQSTIPNFQLPGINY